jgi:hypothetical protein
VNYFSVSRSAFPPKRMCWNNEVSGRVSRRGNEPGKIFMRIVIVVIVASIVSILAFKYVNNSLWNAPIAATAEELSEG